MARSGDNGAASTLHRIANTIRAAIRQAFDHINVRMSCKLARRACISRRNCGSYLCRLAYSSIDAQRGLCQSERDIAISSAHAEEWHALRCDDLLRVLLDLDRCASGRVAQA